MTEPLSKPLVSLPGLTAFGDEAAGFCADGVCDVPDAAAPTTGDSSPGDPAGETRPPTGG